MATPSEETSGKRKAEDELSFYAPPKRPRPRRPGAPSNETPEPKFSNSKELAGAAQWGSIAKNYRQLVYQYTHIKNDFLRLIYLEPGAPTDEICATIRVIRFSELGKGDFRYEALSYHWGDGEAEHSIKVREDEQSFRQMPKTTRKPGMADVVTQAGMYSYKQLKVKPNLHRALRHLRLPNQRVPLWIDALCINQEDLEEKKGQIAKMAQIYHMADNVLIWLGPGDDRTKAAITFIDEVIALEKLQSLISDVKRISDWKALIYLMKFKWFSRRWVIQELALAKSAIVLCGSDSIHWNDFRDAISLFVQNFSAIKKLFRRDETYQNDPYSLEELEPLGAKVLVEIINHIFRKDSKGSQFVPMQSLEWLVSTLATFETSDPRDTIHAFRNICKEVGYLGGPEHNALTQKPPEPDWTKDLLYVYTEFVKWVVNSSGSLDILCRHWAMPERRKKDAPSHYPSVVKLPSWIQQITEAPFGRQGDQLTTRKNGDSFVGLPGSNLYNASYGRKVEATFGKGPRDYSWPKASSPMTIITGPSPKDNISPIDSYFNQNLNPSLKPPTDFTTSGEPVSPLAANGQLHHLLQKGRKKATSESSKSSTVIDPFFGDRDATLNIKGLKVGTLRWVTDPIPDGVIPREPLIRAGWKYRVDTDEDLEDNADDDLDVTVPDKVWRTLVAERGPDGRNAPAWYYRACHHCLVHDTPNGHINTKILLEKSNQPDIVRDFLKRVQAVTWNRRFMEANPEEPWETNGKIFGLGPQNARKGDFICILYGCSVPVILRPRKREDGTVSSFRFIGEAYAYGFMSGEAITTLSEDELQRRTQTFTLL